MTSDESGTSACFIIPTYNEAENIASLLQRLIEDYGSDDVVFLIVDDNSPDGTADLVRSLMQEGNGQIQLIQGERRGLGAAYIRGMVHALEVTGADMVVQMDADFSHDPRDARRLLRRVREGADVAIGSRYVPGGSLDERWSLQRRLQSGLANLLARRVGGIKGVRDCTSGFKAIRAGCLRQARPGTIPVTGYVFQPVLLHRLAQCGARMVEEPIHFNDRKGGETKFDLKRMVEVFRDLWRLSRAGAGRTALKFAVTGVCGVAVNLGSFSALLGLSVPRLIASPIAILTSILSNFLMNNYWTFSDRDGPGSLSSRGVRYLLSSLVSLWVSYSIFVALSVLLPRAPPVLLQASGILPAALINYGLSSRWIFKAGRS